jgi:uncharacterized protein (TIGR03435 family)
LSIRRLALIAFIPALLPAQSPAALQFEVASVKRSHDGPNPGDIPRNMDTSPGHFAMRNIPLRHAIVWAYDLKDYQVSGPDWIKGDERYDIVASAGSPVPESKLRLMLQALLLERFQMKMHREPKELPVYVLTAGKGAPKLKPAADDTPPTLSGNAGSVTFHNQPVSRFAFLLTRRLDRPVLDGTGLSGLYDFQIDLSGLGFAGRPAEDASAPSVFTTVQRDLNLKLEPRKETIDILVIDSASRVPVEN